MDSTHMEPGHVEICIKGRIAENWSEWLHDLEITYTEQGEALLTGALPDQAALYGVLARLRDLGLPLVYVKTGDKSLEYPAEE